MDDLRYANNDVLVVVNCRSLQGFIPIRRARDPWTKRFSEGWNM